MNDPTLFSESNSLQLKHAQEHLETVKDFLKWQQNKNILDVGCADGKVTSTILLPFTSTILNNLVGVDISESMIDYAKKFSSHSKINYQTLDIAGQIPEKYKHFFDYIFSFYCLMMVENQKKTFENLFDMLKPDGKLMFSIVLKSSVLSSILDISKHPVWAIYADNVHDTMYPYEKIDKPAEKLQNILTSEGFKIQVFKVQTKTHRYPRAIFEKFALSVVPFIKNIPKDKLKEFSQDFQHILNNCDDVEIIGDDTVLFKILVATVLVSK